jgi:hypothetical protein
MKAQNPHARIAVISYSIARLSSKKLDGLNT